MLWPCADIGKAELLQEAPDTDFRQINAKPLLDDAFKVDAAPTHHAVVHRIRASHDDRARFSFCAFVNFGGRPGEVALMRPLGPFAL